MEACTGILDSTKEFLVSTSIRTAVKYGCRRRPEARGLERELVSPLAVQSLELLPRGDVVIVQRGGQVQPEEALVPRPVKDKRTENEGYRHETNGQSRGKQHGGREWCRQGGADSLSGPSTLWLYMSTIVYI